MLSIGLSQAGRQEVIGLGAIQAGEWRQSAVPLSLWGQRLVNSGGPYRVNE